MIADLVRHAKRLYGPAQPATSNTTLYTADAKTLLTNIHVVNTTGADATFKLAVNGSAATAASQITPSMTVPANGSYDWNGEASGIPLEAADTIQGLQGTSAALTVTISGVKQ